MAFVAPYGARDFFTFPEMQEGSSALPASYAIRIEVFTPVGRATGRETDHSLFV